MNYRMFLAFLFLFVSIFACDNSGINTSKHIITIKNATMDGYPTTTIGKAFDASFDKPKWETFEANKGERVVQFTGNISKDLHNYVVAEDKFRKDYLAVRDNLRPWNGNDYYLETYDPQFGEALDKIDERSNGNFLKDLKNKYSNCDIIRVTFPTPQYRFFCNNKESQISLVDDVLHTYLNELWKAGDPIIVQWIIYPDGKRFELIYIDSNAWEGKKLDDILTIIYNWQPSTTYSPAEKNTQEPIDIVNKEQEKLDNSADGHKSVDNSNKSIKTFVENFISTVNSRDLNKQLTFYNDFVQMHGKSFSLQEIRQDKENYYKKWDVTIISINGDIEIKNKKHIADVTIPINFNVDSIKRNEAISGTAIINLIISLIDNKWKIIAKSEKIIEQKTYSINKSKSNNTDQNKTKKESTNNTQNEKINNEVDSSAEFDRTVSLYVDYLKGLSLEEQIASCAQSSNSKNLNDFEKAAFKRACEIVMPKQAKPIPQQNPETYPKKQEKEQVDMDRVFDIVQDVIRKF